MKRGDWIALAVAALVVGALALWPRDSQRDDRAAKVAAMADKWSGEIAFGPSYDALSPGAEAEAAAPSRFDPNDAYSGLPRNEGYELVAGFCSGCHSLQIVMQQHHGAETWNRRIDFMLTQGMAPPEPAERARIVAYLVRNFGAQAPEP